MQSSGSSAQRSLRSSSATACAADCSDANLRTCVNCMEPKSIVIHRCSSRRQLQQTALIVQRTAHTRKTYSNPKVLRQTDSVAALLAQIQYAMQLNLTTRNIGLPALVDRGAGWRFVIVITQRAEAQAACSPHSVCTRCNMLQTVPRCWFPHRPTKRAGLGASGAVVCYGSRPQPCVPYYREWNGIGIWCTLHQPEHNYVRRWSNLGTTAYISAT